MKGARISPVELVQEERVDGAMRFTLRLHTHPDNGQGMQAIDMIKRWMAEGRTVRYRHAQCRIVGLSESEGPGGIEMVLMLREV
jgi:hypothetical protein